MVDGIFLEVPVVNGDSLQILGGYLGGFPLRVSGKSGCQWFPMSVLRIRDAVFCIRHCIYFNTPYLVLSLSEASNPEQNRNPRMNALTWLCKKF